MSLIKYSNEYAVPAFGFQNTGVICYFNSMLQGLLSCTSFTETFIKNKDLQTRNALCVSVYELIDRAITGGNELKNIEAMSPKIFRAFLFMIKKDETKKQRFGSGQEDTNEGFLLFIDALEAPEIDELFEHRYRNYIVCGRCNYKHRSTIDDEHSFIEFSEAEFIKDKGNLKKMIMKQHPEIDKDYRCTKCELKCPKCAELKAPNNKREDLCQDCQTLSDKKQIKDYVLSPEILIIMFKKFKKKWSADIPIQFEIPSSAKEGSFQYRLVAVNEHSGSESGGHYWANVLRKDNKFVNLNDTNVTSLDTLKSTQATYMAWYHVA